MSSSFGDVEGAFPEPEQIDYWDATPRQGRPLFDDPPDHAAGRGRDLRAVPGHNGPTEEAPGDGPRWGPRLDAGKLYDDLPKERLVRPTKGWRGAIYEMTHGKVNFGLSKTEQHRRDLINAIRTPLRDVRHVVFWSQKGGVGKTTTCVAAGIQTALQSPQRILGIDTNLDGGSMGALVPGDPSKNILSLRDALHQRDLALTEFVGHYVNQAPHRFDTIPMPPGEKPTHPVTADDYQLISKTLRDRYQYHMIFTDCGTDLSRDVMEGVLAEADLLVVVTPDKRAEGIVTGEGLRALYENGHEYLVDNAITAIIPPNMSGEPTGVVEEYERRSPQIRQWFADNTAAMVTIPHDSRVEYEPFDIDALGEEAQLGFLQLSAEIVTALSRLD